MSRQYIQLPNYELFIIWHLTVCPTQIHFLEDNLKNLTEEIEEAFREENFEKLEVGLQGLNDVRRRVPSVMAINWITNRNYDFIDRNIGTSSDWFLESSLSDWLTNQMSP